jgi:HAMP domain-containing protein
MGLRIKFFLPLLALGLFLSAYLLGVWLPSYTAEKRTERLEQVNEHLTSLSLSLLMPVLDLDFSRIYGLLDDVMLENTAWKSLTLSDSGGRQLYPIDPLDTSAPNLHQVTVEIDYFGEAIGGLALHVDVERELSASLDGLHRLVVVVLILIAAFVVGAGLVIEYVVRRPVAGLSMAANKLTTGQFNAPLPRAGSDELGDLVRTFSTMRESINTYQARLRLELYRQAASEQVQAGRAHVLEQLTSGAPLTAILETLIHSIEGVDEAIRCAVTLVDDERLKLIHGSAPSMPPEFNRSISGLRLNSGTGPAEAALSSKSHASSGFVLHGHNPSFRRTASFSACSPCTETNQRHPMKTSWRICALQLK